MNTNDKLLLRALFAVPTWTDLYILHEKYLLSPGQISRAVRNAVNAGLVELNDFEARLTHAGRIWVVQNRKAIFLAPGRRVWADAGEKVARENSLDTYRPRLPSLRKLDQPFFEALGDD